METTGVKSFLKELGIELVSEFFSIGMMKKILAKEAAKTAEGTAGSEATKIKGGGIFNLTDETAYLALIAQLEQDPANKDTAHKVSLFLNDWKFTDSQRRRFRVVVGHLAQMEYVKVVKHEDVHGKDKWNKPTVTKRSEEVKTNLGIEFLKSFAQHTEGEMMQICQASGIMTGVFYQIGSGIASIGDAITSFEQHPTTQKVMTSLVEKMRAHRQKLYEQRTGGTLR